MSEGEQSSMEKKCVVGRQSPAPSQREAGGYALNKYVRPSAAARKEFSGNGRAAGDCGAAATRRQPMAQQPRNRYCDKRPRPRGPYGVDQKEEVTKTEQPMAEYGSVQAWGSKKTNLNHLLNFHYEQRDLYNSCRWTGPALRTGDSRGKRHGYSRSSVPYNKERFLQANCQFVVRAGPDYKAHAVDPDTLVDWELIEQVRISSHEVPSCPICLFAPTAAKITRCGHIYCWPCMLHYLSLDDRTWRKCPICYEAVHEKDLKSVTALESRQYAIGEQIEMRLMKKLRGSTRVMPASEWSASGCFPSKFSDTLGTCYAKLLVANVDDVRSIVINEKKELELALKQEGESTLEASYISAALRSLEVREQKLAKDETCSGSDLMSSSSVVQDMSVRATELSSSNAAHEQLEIADVKVSLKVDQCYLSAFDETVEEMKESCPITCRGSSSDSEDSCSPPHADFLVGDEPVLVPLEEDLQDLRFTNDDNDESTAEQELTLTKTKEDVLDDAFYFYQAADGQHIYMHAINIRCMVKQFGSLRNCPDIVTATLVEMEPVSMDEELRRRLRYLNHLPLTCEFIMAELDLEPPLVSQQVLDDFADDLEKRRQNRARRAREDKRRAYRIQAEENRKMGIDPTMRIVRSEYSRTQPVESETVPTWHVDDPNEGVLSSSADSSVAVEAVSGRGPRTESTSSQDSTGMLPSVPSFAQMLKAGKAKPAVDAWPRVQKAKEGEVEHGINDDGGYPLAAPRHQTSLCDAIQAALDNYSKECEVVAVEPNGVQSPGTAACGKKKKVKKLLFSTSLPRSK